MPDTASLALAPWSNFYVIAGSSAAGLTGLMFVVITLVVGFRQSQATADGIATYSTPTVIHFCVALVISAVMSAPWRTVIAVAGVLALIGLYGIAYVLRIMRAVKQQTIYQAEAEDWLWYTILPLVAYAAILASAIGLVAGLPPALFVLAAAIVLLILIGIHNAWDVVTYIALGQLAATAPDPAPAAVVAPPADATAPESPRPGGSD